MKKTLIMCISFFLMQCSSSEIKNENRIFAAYTAQSITVDGTPNESIWQTAKPILLKENRTGNEVSDKQVQTQVKACYDDSSLYFFFTCNDPDIWTSFTQRDEHLWEEEAVEIFIDVDEVSETYVEIEVSPANILFDSYIVDPKNIDVSGTALFDLKGIQTAVALSGTLNNREDKDEMWTVEIAIPFKDLANELIDQVNNETDIKINFYRLDKNNGKNPMSYAWSPTGGRFHKPVVFGRLIFEK